MRNTDCWYESVCCNECSASCLRFIEMKYLMDNSGIPENKQLPSQLIPETQDREAFRILNDIKSHVVDFVHSGQNLYIWGNHTGNGKTSWALKIMMKYFDEIWAGNGFRTRGKFVHVPTLLVKLKDFSNPLSEEYKNDILNCDLLILDDIASAGISQYDLTQLLLYIDHRTMYEKSTIYTGNLGFNDLHSALGAKLASRIWSNTTTKVELKGADRR